MFNIPQNTYLNLPAKQKKKKRIKRKENAYHCVREMLLKCIFHAKFICNDVDSMSDTDSGVTSTEADVATYKPQKCV